MYDRERYRGWVLEMRNIIIAECTVKTRRIELFDWDVTITDEYGILWRGYVVDIAVNESEISITGTGYRTKLDGVYYTGYYDSEPVNTTPTIIRYTESCS